MVKLSALYECVWTSPRGCVHSTVGDLWMVTPTRWHPTSNSPDVIGR